MVITGKEIQRLSYKLCQEIGEEDNLELLNRVALFLFYENHALGFNVETDRWKVCGGHPQLFDTIPKYSRRRKGTVPDWYWYLIKGEYDLWLSKVKIFHLVNKFESSNTLELVTSLADWHNLSRRELLQISFYALHI